MRIEKTMEIVLDNLLPLVIASKIALKLAPNKELEDAVKAIEEALQTSSEDDKKAGD